MPVGEWVDDGRAVMARAGKFRTQDNKPRLCRRVQRGSSRSAGTSTAAQAPSAWLPAGALVVELQSLSDGRVVCRAAFSRPSLTTFKRVSKRLVNHHELVEQHTLESQHTWLDPMSQKQKFKSTLKHTADAVHVGEKEALEGGGYALAQERKGRLRHGLG